MKSVQGIEPDTVRGIKKSKFALYPPGAQSWGRAGPHQIILFWVIVWQVTEDRCWEVLWKYQGRRDHFWFDGQTKLPGRNNLDKKWEKSGKHNGGDRESSCQKIMSKHPRAGMRGHPWGCRCVMERRQEKGSGPHFQCEKCHGQEVGLYSGEMDNVCFPLGIRTGEMTRSE